MNTAGTVSIQEFVLLILKHLKIAQYLFLSFPDLIGESSIEIF